jgi:hypothetical protein
MFINLVEIRNSSNLNFICIVKTEYVGKNNLMNQIKILLKKNVIFVKIVILILIFN